MSRNALPDVLAAPDVYQELRRFLSMVVSHLKYAMPKHEMPYSNAMDFILQHGVKYEPAPWDDEFKEGTKKECYSNSYILAAQTGLRYVEGYAVAPGVSMPVLHAWNLNEEDQVIDTTWKSSGLVYLGVVFDVQRIDETVTAGEGAILDDWIRNYPVLQKPWTGEDPNRIWPYSAELEYISCVHPWQSNRKVEHYEPWRTKRVLQAC